MLKINQLLNRFKNLTNNEKIKKQLIIEILVKNKIPSNIKQISIIKNILFIKTQPIIKTEFLFKKNEILNQIKQISGLENISEIK